MLPAQEAVRAWFRARAYIPSEYHPSAGPDEKATQEFWDHINGGCALVWVKEPDRGVGYGYMRREFPGVVATLACSCDKYEAVYDDRDLFIPGEWTLAELLQEICDDWEGR